MARRSLRTPILSLALALGLAVTSTATAAPGDLDTSFGGDGYVLTMFAGGGGTFYGVALDGSAPTGCGQGGITLIAVRREGGALDDTFSGDGRLKTDPLDTGTSALQSCVYLPGGRLLGVGWVGPEDAERLLVAVFQPNGRPDPSFSGDGFAAFRFPGFPQAFGYGVAVQDDGRIVVAGEATGDGSNGDFAIARLLPGGALDDTFDGDGRMTVNFGPGSDGGWKVAVDSAGRIVVAGWTDDTVGMDYDAALTVLRPGGHRDRRFADEGRWVGDLNPDDDYVNGLDLRPDDRIVLGVTFPGDAGHAVVQLRRGGGFDDAFANGDGFLKNVTPAMTLRDLELRGKKIVFAGQWSGTPQFVRLTGSGGLDGTFGAGGVATIGDLTGALVDDLAHDPQGRIAAAGTSAGNVPLLFRLDG